jgi:L-rhamnose mutarotase
MREKELPQMNRFALTNTLRNDPNVIAKYDESHAAVWPEVLEDNRRAGLRKMYIYRFETRLFMFCESTGVDPERLESLAQSQRSRDWQALMKSLFVPTSEGMGSAGWRPMKEVMAFEWSPESV